ncbi:lipopolysaccharide biosynthesis protein [Curtobacterium flaccumfaciens]|uniref:lipopolysaccharide biosynthesis protein n=1 Tax=Curtobacterium flaccumfaciens TaxID=2035 RepID=UPI003F7D71B7
MADRRSLTSRVLISMIGNVFAPLAGIATAPILAHALGVIGRGESAAATAPLLLAVASSTLGIPTAVTYFVARSPGLFGPLLRKGGLILALAGLVATAMVVLLSMRLAADDRSLAQLTCIAAVAIVPTLLVSLVQATAAAQHRWALVAAERAVSAFARLVLIAGLALAGHLTVEAAVAVLAFAPLLGGIVYLRMKSRTDGAELGAVPERPRLLSYGVRTWIGSISGVLLTRLDQTLMVPLSDASALGLYAVAVTVAELPLVVNNAVRDVMFSQDSELSGDDSLARSSRISTLVTFIVSGGLALCTPFVPFVFGAGFDGSIPVILVLLVAVVAGNPGSIAGVGLSSRGRPELRSLSLLIACVVNAGAVIVLVPFLGAMGAAIATLIGNVLASNLNLFLLRRVAGIAPVEFYRIGFTEVQEIGRLVRNIGARSRAMLANRK